MTINLPIVTLQQVMDIAQQKGFTLDEAQVAAAVANSEGTSPSGTANIVGDNGTSFGPFQFHIGGQLNNFASWLGTLFGSQVSLQQAAQVANSNQGLAVSYALDHYLGNAIRAGTASGLHGADLARYASRFGQISAFPDNAANAYNRLFGGPIPLPVKPGSAGDATTPSTSQEPGQINSPPADSVSGDVKLFSTPFGNINIPTGLIAVLMGLGLLLIGAILTFVVVQKPSITVKTIKAST